MQRNLRSKIVALSFSIAVALIALGASEPLLANSVAVEVEDAWARPAIAQGNGAAYFVMRNVGDQPVTLVGASSTVAKYTEIHETYVIDSDHSHGDHEDDHSHHHHHDHGHDHHGAASQMLGMRKIDALPLAPGEELSFEPGGYHVMLIELQQALSWGESFEMILHFEEDYSLSVPVSVGSGPAR